MDTADFLRAWRSWLPFTPPAPASIEAELARKLRGHRIWLAREEPTATLVGMARRRDPTTAEVFGLGLSTVALVQIRRAVADIDTEALAGPGSEPEPRLTPPDPSLCHVGVTARIAVFDRGMATLRVGIDEPGGKGFTDLRLDAGLARALAALTRGDNPLAETLARFDAAAGHLH